MHTSSSTLSSSDVRVCMWLLQGRLVKGTTASTPASVVLQPGDKLLMANGMNLEMWGKQRTQDVRDGQLCAAATLQPP